MVLDSSLQTWERDYFHALASRLDAEVHFPVQSARDSRLVARDKMWFISRRWREWSDYYQGPGVFFSPLGPYFGNVNFLSHLKNKFTNHAPTPHLLGHSSLSHRFFREVEHRPADKVTFVELPYIPTEVAAKTPDTAIKGVLRVAVLSDFDPESNLNAVTSVAHYVRRHNANVQFQVRGKGPLLKYFMDQVRELGLQQTVVFENSRVPTECEVFLHLAARNEHFLHLYQASSSGLPVIAYETSEIGAFVKDAHSGFLVPMHQTKSAAELLLRFADDPLLRQSLGLKLRASCAEHQWTGEKGRHLSDLFKQATEISRAA